MNGQAAKRLRLAARITSKPEDRRSTYKRLKKEYKEVPIHRRKFPHWMKEPHSVVLKRTMDRWSGTQVYE